MKMGDILSNSIESHFGRITDPRRETKNKQHKFHDILIIAICGSICGGNDWVAIERFGQSKFEWFSSFLELPNGIPSHDTFNDVFSKLDPSEFEAGFISWVSSIAHLLPGEVVAIDGKTLRRSHDKGAGKSAIHMVSAWASRNSLVLGQLKTEEKSNEITAIPELLNHLALKGCLVTIDAMGCQKNIVKTIVDQEADYLIALKENQPKLYESVVDYFEDSKEKNGEDCAIDFSETIEKNHGRDEKRRCWVGRDIDRIESADQWERLNAVVMIESERTLNGKTSLEHRYYISSADTDAEKLLSATREHWGIENSLHWVLDVAFREDDSRLRKKNGAQNAAILKHIALNLLKKETSAKVGIQNKRLMAGWNHKYLRKVLDGIHT